MPPRQNNVRGHQANRLNEVHKELNNLDAEIEGLYKYLESDSNDYDLLDSDPEDNIMMNRSIRPPRNDPRSPYKGQANRDRLYTESVNVLEKRTHKIETTLTDEDVSELMLPKPKIYIPNYRPPSERIFDSTNKKEKLIRNAQRERERKFNEEYTFHPQINEKSARIPYDPNHLLENPHKQVAEEKPRHERLINGRSEKIAEKSIKNGNDFLSRQFQRSKSVQNRRAETPTKKRISKADQESMIERLTRPVQIPVARVEETPVKKRTKPADPKTFERLVSRSMKKEVKVEAQPKVHESKMNPISKQLTENITVDLHEESIQAQVRARKRAEEVKQWHELSEVAECTFAPQIRRTRAPTPTKRKIAGMDDFVERLQKKQQQNHNNDENSKIKKVSKAMYVRPFSFENRPKKDTQTLDRDVESVLSEINQLLQS